MSVTVRNLLLAIGLLPVPALMGQDPQFTQFYADQTYLSPAFAGTSAGSRAGMIFRDQWPAIPGAFITYAAAFDHYLSEFNSGIGLRVMHDKAGSGGLRYTSVAGQYAYEIELKRKVFLRPALQFGFVNHAVDYSRLVFGDQLARGSTVGTYEHLDGTSVGYADMGTGLLLFTPRLWVGVSVHHLNRPNQSLLGAASEVPRKFSAHGGYRWTLRAPVIRERGQHVVAAFNYRSQGKYDQLDLGAYYEHEPFFAGLWYRGIPLMKAYEPGYGNHDALSVVIGVIVNDMRIGYSYDITVSKLAWQSAGAHELSVVYEWADKRRKRSMAKRRIVPCAKF